MRALRLPRRLVFALALLLVGGQQAALAHLLGHVADLGNASTLVVAQQGDDEHGAALTLSHVCTTCIALDTFTAPPPALPCISFADGALAVPPAPTFSEFVTATPRRYAARAPPPLL